MFWPGWPDGPAPIEFRDGSSGRPLDGLRAPLFPSLLACWSFGGPFMPGEGGGNMDLLGPIRLFGPIPGGYCGPDPWHE
jgi:hypothetical protein